MDYTGIDRERITVSREAKPPASLLFGALILRRTTPAPRIMGHDRDDRLDVASTPKTVR